MRINLPASLELLDKMTQPLQQLLEDVQKLIDLELPLNQKGDLIQGQVVELTWQNESTIAVRSPALDQQPLVAKQLTQLLMDLNVPPTAEAVLVAQGLLERGYALQESLIWHLMPWAEQGQLDEAFMLFEAKYPVEPKLLAMARELQSQNVGEVLLAGARDETPSELQELLEYPSLESRFKWSAAFAEGETFKALVRLLVEERLVEALLAHDQVFVFALPFLQGDDLYASWVRIQRGATTEDEEEPRGFDLELEIPTKTLGVIGANLAVRGSNLAITIRVMEHEEMMAEALESLKQELRASGWNLQKLQVRGWDHAQGSSSPL